MTRQLSQFSATQKTFNSLATSLLMQEMRPIELYKQTFNHTHLSLAKLEKERHN